MITKLQYDFKYQIYVVQTTYLYSILWNIIDPVACVIYYLCLGIDLYYVVTSEIARESTVIWNLVL